MPSQYEYFDNYGFSSTIWSPFFDGAPIKRYKNGSYIYLQDQPPEYFYYLKRGSVRSLISSESGVEKVLTIYKEGSFFGEASFFDESPRMSSALAVSDCDIIVIDRPTVTQRMAKNPELAMSMMKYLSRTVRVLSAQIDSMTFLQADKRIARWLITTSGEGKEHISYTHEEISSMIGASRVTVSRTLGTFSKNGFIETRYKSIVILDYNKLKAFAEI